MRRDAARCGSRDRRLASGRLCAPAGTAQRPGVAGSVIGGRVANLIGTGDIMELNVLGFIVAVFASVALLAAAERAGLGQGEHRQRLSRG